MSVDKTDFARSWGGYCGKRRVIIEDGCVISHGSVDWFDFLAAERRKSLRRTHHQHMLALAFAEHLKLQT